MLLTFLLHTIAMGFKTVNLRGGDLAALQQKQLTVLIRASPFSRIVISSDP